MKDLAYSELIPVTIRAVQELNQELETEVAQKNHELEDLKRRLEKLEQIVTQEPK